MTPPLIHTVSIQARTGTGFNDFGEKIFTWANIYTSIPCRVEEYEPKIEYNESGQRAVKKTLVYFEPTRTLLNSQNRVVAVSVPGYTNGQTIGLVKDVIRAGVAFTNALNHIEVTLEDVVAN